MLSWPELFFWIGIFTGAGLGSFGTSAVDGLRWGLEAGTMWDIRSLFFLRGHMGSTEVSLSLRKSQQLSPYKFLGNFANKPLPLHLLPLQLLLSEELEVLLLSERAHGHRDHRCRVPGLYWAPVTPPPRLCIWLWVVRGAPGVLGKVWLNCVGVQGSLSAGVMTVIDQWQASCHHSQISNNSSSM